MKNRVGLLGGTFNPIHNGHIDLGMKIKEAFRLDLIRYILSAKPPHKNNKTIINSDLRWKMLKIALEKNTDFVPCDIELKRKKPSYTIDTIKELSNIFPLEKHFFIIGSDSFLKIETWKEYIKLLKIISFIVVLRDETHKKDSMTILDKINIKYAEADFISEESKKKENKVFFYSYQSDKLNYSSTIVRESIRDRKEIKNMVDQNIINIIKGNGLYGS